MTDPERLDDRLRRLHTAGALAEFEASLERVGRLVATDPRLAELSAAAVASRRLFAAAAAAIVQPSPDIVPTGASPAGAAAAENRR